MTDDEFEMRADAISVEAEALYARLYAVICERCRTAPNMLIALKALSGVMGTVAAQLMVPGTDAYREHLCDWLNAELNGDIGGEFARLSGDEEDKS